MMNQRDAVPQAQESRKTRWRRKAWSEEEKEKRGVRGEQKSKWWGEKKGKKQME